ncbi:MAG TPA: NAD(P)-binding domain-containing protein [Gemmatimonadales bacterium]|nr:NAD(P)-binding domain-containing protein [Gemmatimonadales bacterium]
MSGLPTAAIIGAGSSGLAAAKNFREAGFEVTVFERQDDVGGNWNFGKPTARVYRSTHTISSKPGTQFPDFPMPAAFPDYPHHTQILQYLRDYANHFDLLPRIRFNSGVSRVEPLIDNDARTRWRISLDTGEAGEFDVLAVANGHNWFPKQPDYPGTFTGGTLHSAEYRDPGIFVGQRVLVVGGGNSGCDIVVEAAQNAEHAWHSTRRGYWYMPKYLMGTPADEVNDRMLALGVPLWLRRALAMIGHRMAVGSRKRSGLPAPDHKLFETHPIVNSLLPYYVGHGDITPKPDVTRFDGRTVHFKDGTSADLDVIVFATGFLIRFPFMEERLLNWQDGKPRLYLNVFHPLYDTLFVAGLIQPDSGQFGLVHWQTVAAARYARASHEGRGAAEALRNRKQDPSDDAGNGIRYTDSTRHHVEVEHWSYRKKLQRWAKLLG